MNLMLYIQYMIIERTVPFIKIFIWYAVMNYGTNLRLVQIGKVQTAGKPSYCLCSVLMGRGHSGPHHRRLLPECQILAASNSVGDADCIQKHYVG